MWKGGGVILGFVGRRWAGTVVVEGDGGVIGYMPCMYGEGG